MTADGVAFTEQGGPHGKSTRMEGSEASRWLGFAEEAGERIAAPPKRKRDARRQRIDSRRRSISEEQEFIRFRIGRSVPWWRAEGRAANGGEAMPVARAWAASCVFERLAELPLSYEERRREGTRVLPAGRGDERRWRAALASAGRKSGAESALLLARPLTSSVTGGEDGE